MGHSHAPTASGRHRGRLAAALAITVTVMVVEVIGAWLTGSLALLADAGHMLSDATGLTLALIATWLAARPTSHRWTFGWQRAEVLAALANGVILAVVAVTVLIEGLRRFSTPGEVEAPVMLAVGALGLVANLVALRLLAAGQKESLNVRGAYLEVLGDLLGSVAVIAAALVIATTGWVQADAVASIAIAVLIAPRAFSLLRDVARVLLEGTPKEMELDTVRRHLAGVPGVVAVHDLHAWTITSGVPVLSAHVVVDDDVLDPARFCGVLDELQHCLRGHFDVEHSTLQLEPATHTERGVHA
ncbi:cation diffusion facilitator family transporter [Beutenbergia cavernae DSM 12333]|uniref:Cation diffusion facilitator family transporter n=1 Tax=Beutenbergia cavernae (strain ATCC BAA-8 / DSM 12333 / CCUG 43141 / JCM 11478 / NBRC 16432 / NCIMB 13614 / HKI 0122) TaxID=471853 RepID=C5C2B3_BEUC1|nr:cation diffusion facilitator family transporter [Beutenbergia cavernae]ACQ81738.1 cation diffusion facilitator family transporter [Beutenbergia cavernae DSM 12333]